MFSKRISGSFLLSLISLTIAFLASLHIIEKRYDERQNIEAADSNYQCSDSDSE